MPPGPAFFLRIVNGRSASAKRMPARCRIAGADHQHRRGGPDSSGYSSRHVIAPGIDAVELKLLRERPPQPAIERLTRHEFHRSSATGRPKRMGDTASAVTKAADGGIANRRTSAHAASTSLLEVPRHGVLRPGRVRAPMPGSPVICTSEHKSVGMLTSARAAAIASSSSEKGWPAYGLRGPCVTRASCHGTLRDGLPTRTTELPRSSSSHVNVNVNVTL